MSTDSPLRYPSDDINPYAPPKVALDAEPADLNLSGDLTAAEAIRKEHIGHEASIKSIGLLHYLGAFFGSLIAFGSVFSAFFVPAERGAAARGLLIGIGLFYLALSGLQLALGIGLRRLRVWARWTEVVLISLPLACYGIAAIILIVIRGDPSSLVGILFGSAILGYILYLLVAPKAKVIFSAEYQTIIAQTPHIKYRTSLLVRIAVVFLVVVTVLGLVSAFMGRSR